MYKNNEYYLEKLEENPVLQDSMMLRLVQISENAKDLTD